MSYDFTDEFFTHQVPLPEGFDADVEVRHALEWFLSFLPDGEWGKRRIALATRLYDTALSKIEADDKGKLYDQRDSFGWYLFLAEASLDHLHNYDPTFGSRVLPVFKSIGRNLDQIRRIEGVDERVRRALRSDRAQPNGTLFELVVAASYVRAGGAVAFVPEQPGGPRTHDFNAHVNGVDYAVECKRMETGEYSERERHRMRELWQPCAQSLTEAARSTLGNVEFYVPLEEVPGDHLAKLARRFLASANGELKWEGQISSGSMVPLDLGPLRDMLATDLVLIGSTRWQEKLSGKYVRNRAFLSAALIEPADNPRFADKVDFALLQQWQSNSDKAISGKARDVIGKLIEANDQLPADTRSIVHVGFEAVEGDAVERIRLEKIAESVGRFDPRGKRLEFVYCHCFVPECPPDIFWAYDETTHLFGIRPEGPPPLDKPFLVLPSDADMRDGPHWL